MIIIDGYIIHLLMATPLLAAIFITLIPAVDTGSKLAMSKFFSLAGFLIFLRLAYLFLDNKMPEQHLLSINLTQFNINIIISITKYNIFLFGAISMSLLADMFLYEFNDTKSNTHQVAPFLLTFILFISLGQKDIRVALPIISVANFIIYFIIGHSTKRSRGAAIFHTGIFILTCDALSLVLLQFQPMANDGTAASNLMQMAILLPGLSRVTLPICAPFMNTLFLNLDESEGPFILTFLHIAGFFILFLTRGELTIDREILSATIGCAAVIGALFIALTVIHERKISVLPYYFLAFYSALTVSIIFIFDESKSWYISAIIFLTSIAVFMHATKSAILVEQYRNLRTNKSKIAATWFLSVCLLVGIPGIGIGTVAWPMFYLMFEHHNSSPQPYQSLWSAIILSWIAALMILAYGLFTKTSADYSGGDLTRRGQLLSIKTSFLISPLLVALLTLIIPLVTIYASSKLLK